MCISFYSFCSSHLLIMDQFNSFTWNLFCSFIVVVVVVVMCRQIKEFEFAVFASNKFIIEGTILQRIQFRFSIKCSVDCLLKMSVLWSDHQFTRNKHAIFIPSIDIFVQKKMVISLLICTLFQMYWMLRDEVFFL